MYTVYFGILNFKEYVDERVKFYWCDFFLVELYFSLDKMIEVEGCV